MLLTRPYSPRHCKAQGEDDGRAHDPAKPIPPQFPIQLAAHFEKRIHKLEVLFATRAGELSAKVELHRRRLDHTNQTLQLAAAEQHTQHGNREEIVSRYRQHHGERPQCVSFWKQLWYVCSIGSIGVLDAPINYSAFTRSSGDNPLLVIASVLAASVGLSCSAHYVGRKLKDDDSRRQRNTAYGGLAVTLALILIIAVVRKDSLAEFARQFLPGVDVWGFVTLYFVLQCVLYGIGLAIAYAHRDRLRDVYQDAHNAYGLASKSRVSAYGKSCDVGYNLASVNNRQQVEALKFRNAIIAEIAAFRERRADYTAAFLRYGGSDPPNPQGPAAPRLPKSFRDIDDRFNRGDFD